MAFGEGERTQQLEERLLPARGEEGSFTFRPASAEDCHLLTVDVEDNGESIFTSGSPTGTGPLLRDVDEEPISAPFIPQTPQPFRSSPTRDPNENVSRETRKEKARRAQNRRGLRNPIARKSLVKQAAHTAAHHPVHFLKTLLWGLILWPKWAWESMVSQKNLTIISLKAGIAAGLVSIMCVVRFTPPYDELSSIAVWAVVTVDIIYEGNIGLSLSKGVNRVAGTLCAGALAVLLTQLAPDVPGNIYPYYVVFWVFLGGFAFRFLKGIPPLKDQWGYAFTVATIAFHILLLNAFLQPERVTLPILRFAMILLGFFLASVINLAIKPLYAGDSLHKLVPKNFDAAASILSRCVREYTNFTMLDHVPDILSGRSVDDKIHQSYHEIVMSDSDVDKLLGAVTWEPCHGPFFRGYPWHLYDDITDYLRYTLYDVIALDSCLRASVQAPKPLRDIFAKEMQEIADECSDVLRCLGDSVRNMTTFDSEDILRRAEEAALALQNKIYIHTPLLLGRGAVNSPRYPLYVASCRSNEDPWADPNSKSTRQHPNATNEDDYDPVNPWARNEQDQFGTSPPGETPVLRTPRSRSMDGQERPEENTSASSPPIAILEQENLPTGVNPRNGDHRGIEAYPKSIGSNYASYDETEHSVLTAWQDSPHLSRSNSTQLDMDRQSVAYSRRNSTDLMDRDPTGLTRNSAPTESAQIDEDGVQDGRVKSTDPKLASLNTAGKPPRGWKHNFMKRRSSLGPDYEGALERISALSLVKFASLLIEVVAKMKYVVTSVQELGEAAKFKSHIPPSSLEPSLRSGIGR